MSNEDAADQFSAKEFVNNFIMILDQGTLLNLLGFIKNKNEQRFVKTIKREMSNMKEHQSYPYNWRPDNDRVYADASGIQFSKVFGIENFMRMPAFDYIQQMYNKLQPKIIQQIIENVVTFKDVLGSNVSEEKTENADLYQLIAEIEQVSNEDADQNFTLRKVNLVSLYVAKKIMSELIKNNLEVFKKLFEGTKQNQELLKNSQANTRNLSQLEEQKNILSEMKTKMSIKSLLDACVSLIKEDKNSNKRLFDDTISDEAIADIEGIQAQNYMRN